MTFELEDYYFERHIVYNVTVLFAEVNFYQILHLHHASIIDNLCWFHKVIFIFRLCM